MRIALAMKILKNGPCGVCGSERFGSADAAISKELGYEESVGLACWSDRVRWLKVVVKISNKWAYSGKRAEPFILLYILFPTLE